MEAGSLPSSSFSFTGIFLRSHLHTKTSDLSYAPSERT